MNKIIFIFLLGQWFIALYNTLRTPLQVLKLSLIEVFFSKTYFLVTYFQRNELICQEGLLLDFLQKKVIDKWTRKFLIISTYLVNERLFFDWVIRFYVDLVIWPGHRNTIFEFLSIGTTLFALMLFLVILLLLSFLLYVTL